MDHSRLHARARTKGVNPIVYWLMRAWLQPFAHIYWRLSRIGREHIPDSGPVIFVAAAIPNPFFDAVGIVAGATRMPLGWFWIACFLGKTIRFWLIALAGDSWLPPP